MGVTRRIPSGTRERLFRTWSFGPCITVRVLLASAFPRPDAAGRRRDRRPDPGGSGLLRVRCLSCWCRGAGARAQRRGAQRPAGTSARAGSWAGACAPFGWWSTWSTWSSWDPWSSSIVVSSNGSLPLEHPVEALAVEAAGPGADQHGGDRVAREVGQRAGLGHEPVDADDQADAVDQVGAVRGEPAGQGGQAGAGDAGRALRGDDHEHQQRDLLADAQRVAQRGGDEQRRHGQVDRGAVEVEGVAGRDHDAHGRLVDAGVLHLRDQPRQRRLRRRGRQDQQELAAEVAQQREDVHAGGELEQRAEDDEHEDRAGHVEAEHDHGEALQGVDAGLADDGGDGAERADRGGPHDHRQDPEDQALEVLDAAEHRLAAGGPSPAGRSRRAARRAGSAAPRRR